MQLGDERRRVQRFPVRALFRKRDRQPLARSRAGDVAEVTLARNLVEHVGAERGILTFHFVAVAVRQNRGRAGRSRKNGFVHAQQQREFQVGIPRAVNRAHQHLIQRGRNHADSQAGEAGFKYWQPVTQNHLFMRECEREVVQPRIHLREYGLMNFRFPISDFRFFRVQRPAF